MRASIIIAAHNEGEALGKTVQACVETCAGLDYEIVIADDASADDAVAEVQRRFPRLRVVRHEERCGAAPTKDLGAREARGDVFVFLDGHCNPEHGAIARLVCDIEDSKGNALITPAIAGLDVQRWRNSPSQIGHGYFLDLEKFDCGWLPLSELRGVDIGRRRFYESPASIGCALALSRELYEDLWGFDRHMRLWGVEDLDFGLKSWLMGHPILHDPEAVVGHRFRASFDNYDVPVEHTVVNQLRMARKNFTHGVWSEWLDRCRMRHPGRLPEHPEGLWARVWELFEAQRASVEQERAYLQARRVRDEFWYAERFGLTWPRLHSAPVTLAHSSHLMQIAASPTPPPCPHTDEYAYSVATKKPGGTGLEGGSTKITTRDVKLQCQPDSTFLTHSVAYVTVNKSTMWAQAGYVTERVSGSKTILKGRYFEVRAGRKKEDYYYKRGDAVGTGSHAYKVDLDGATGKWTATYDGDTWEGSSFTNDGWKNVTGDNIQYSGEIYVTQTDMVGTAANKCEFTECQYRLKGGMYVDAGLVAGDLKSTDQKEWDYEYVNGTSFKIWDVKPIAK